LLIEGRGLCISFFSHRWERPSRDPAEAHPDSTDHKKAFALSMYGKFGFCSVFSPTHHFDYYFWIDFAGVNQYNLREKHLGMSVLCAFAAATVEIIMYNSSTASYEPRAWTRLERMLGYMAFSGNLDLVCSVFQTFVLLFSEHGNPEKSTVFMEKILV